ncbi:FkbM family methyltransferase [bacterium]|nr:FkbM family methyltransferase [bacterium]MBU1754435.1 FkbM family methyltransferase [bacterium]
MKQIIKLVILSLIGAFTKKLLGRHVYALIITSANGLCYAVDPEDYGVGRKLRMTGEYGLDEIERLKPHITPDSKVLIIGAHVGTLAIPISKLCKDVVAIEANPTTYNLLTTNIVLNSISNCRAINIAANDKDENIEFLISRANSGGSKRVPKIKKFVYYYDNPEKISIKAVILDKYLEEKKFDIIIMDIEGAEYFALQGMQEILSKCKLLVVEFLPHHLKNVSGVTVEQFLSVITPHFSKLTIPSKQLVLDVSGCVDCLTEMYNLEQGDNGIIFEKV